MRAEPGSSVTDPLEGKSLTPRAPLLDIRDLVVEFATGRGTVHAVRGVSYSVYAGETLGVVGESGSGKSVTVLSLLGLIPSPPGRVVAGEAIFDGRDLLRMSRDELRKVRGREIGMVFQDPMTSLNPVMRVGDQIGEAVREQSPVRLSRAQGNDRAVEQLNLVGVPSPANRARQYPHEFSGGMRQRAVIAIATASTPKLLIADEPTTALDVTIQAQILDLLREHRAADAASILITHDLGVIAEMADRVVVMYAGRVVESADVSTIFHRPRHPYTVGLLNGLPRPNSDDELRPIPGQPPSMLDELPGCPFQPRCALGRDRVRCRTERPELQTATSPTHHTACHFPAEVEDLRSTGAREEPVVG